MQSIFNIFNIPFGYVMRFLSVILGGNFAAAVLVFTLLINLILIPLSIKSQKSTVQQTRIKPKLDELKKKYGDDKQKYSQAMQSLYQEEGVSMSGGCLPMVVRLVLMMSIYWIILSPLTYMANADNTKITNVSNAISTGMTALEKEDEDKYDEIISKLDIDAKTLKGNRSSQLVIIKIIRENPQLIEDMMSEDEYDDIKSDLESIIDADKKTNIDYSLFGLNLTETPHFSVNIFNDWQPIWIMPVVAFLAQMITSALSLLMQKKINPDAPNMAAMMLLMPLMTLFIGFGLPGGVAFYWACSSLIGGLIQVGVQNFYGPHKMLSRERAKELVKQCDLEATQLKNRKTVLNGEQQD